MLWIDVGDSTSKIQPAKSLDYSWIRRPRPSPRQGRRLGPPQVWNLSFLASSASMLRGSFDQISLPFASTVLSRSHPSLQLPFAKRCARPHPSLLLGGPACRSPGVTRFKPFKRLNILLACLIPQPTGTPRPHQWLLMGVQACRLPALKPLKGLKPLKPCKSFSERPTAQAKAAPRPHPSLLLGGPACHSPGVTRFKPFERLNILLACLIPQPTGTPGSHQWLLMGVQAWSLPALKPLKGLKPLKPRKSFSERPTVQAKATPRPHPSLLLGGPACRSPGVTLQTLQTLKHSLGMPHPAANRHPKATSIASYGRPSLPFANP